MDREANYIKEKAKWLDEHDKEIRLNTIKKVLTIADCSHTDCWDCAFSDADLCKLQMLYKEYRDD